ncbi:MAG TPA: hypothetical protein VK964_19175 [Nocardioidaceae bacterium]|nr:hypothetical protein [Nocardioidaceae bacterium]
MDRLVQLLAPYHGWDPRTPSGQYVAGGVGRHAKPFIAVDDLADGGTTYIRAGCRRASTSPTVEEAAAAEGAAV